VRLKNLLIISLALLLTLILASTVVAGSSPVQVDIIKNQISPSEQAEFKITVTNKHSERQRYSIYSFDQGWNVDPSPLKDKIIDVGVGGSYSVIIRAQPTEELPPGIYYVTITVEGDLGESQTIPLKTYLSSDKAIDYLPSIKAEIDMDEKIDPREPLSVKLFLENRNPLNLRNLTIKLQSEMPEFSKNVAIDLPPLDKKTMEFTITPNKYQQPKKYILFFVFERKGQVVKVLEKRVEIVTLTTEFSRDVVEETVFLKKFMQLSIINEGNVINTQEVKFPITFWQSLFVKSDATVKVIDDQRHLVWESTLDPGELETINFTVNYRILFYILLIAALLAIFYWAVQSPVELTKKAIATRSGDSGALSEIKVTLELKNKTKGPVKNISVIDLVPAIANVEKSLELGTLKPHDIKHTKQGTRVVWNLTEIDGHEHRLITYKLRAKLNILGTFSLPRAQVKYGKRGKKKGTAYSNVFKLKTN